MHNFGILFRYEMKRIWRTRAALPALLVCSAVLFLLSLLEGVVIDPAERAVFRAEQSLNGRAVDDALIGEMIAEMTADEATHSMVLPEGSPYRNLGKFLSRSTGAAMTTIEGLSEPPELSELTEDSLYATREEILRFLWDYFRLTDGEKAYWSARETEIAKPFVWQSAAGVRHIRSGFMALTAVFCIVAGVCLAGVFAGDRVARTDALVLSSRYGRRDVFLVRVLAGEASGLLIGASLYASLNLPYLLFYGLRGSDALWQLITPLSSYACSAGRMLLTYTGVFFLACLAVSALYLLLSLLTGNTAAVTGAGFALVILDLFLTLPPRLRVVSQLRYLSPIQVLGNSSFSDPRLLRLPGQYFSSFQTAAVLYVLLAVLFALLAGRRYIRQDAGR